ncbi:MAG: DoxX family protein [Erythrobacter sp.]|nr:DoxX family protein [Erythrobacter sp.]
MSNISVTIGRVLLGLYFLLPGLMKASGPDQTIAYMKSHNIAFAAPLMWIATITNIVGGLLLITGRHVKLVAYGFVVYVLLVNVMLHDFWAVAPDMVERETQNFIKNLGILAGLMVLAGFSPARSLSPSDLFRSDKAAAA